VLVSLTAQEETRGNCQPVLVEEVVADRLLSAFRFGTWLLGRVDSKDRLTQVAAAARIDGGWHLASCTRAEHAGSPNSVSLPTLTGEDTAPVHLTPAYRPRAALRFEATHLAEDLLTLLRRQRRG
jgi:hypothetical protein